MGFIESKKAQLEAIQGDDHRFLLGVTGGIAGGKTTVSSMLAELGAPLIDFDILARKVVEPGEPAWNDITDFFGKDVLQKDRTLDRKKLSDIVFNDAEKRKVLERFTHERINELFIQQVNEVASQHPAGIIQVSIPLMIELNLQYMFHKVLVVYVPREIQIERLSLRDKISREAAEIIINAQMPIDDKKACADFIVYNDKTLEETRMQVQSIWNALKVFQNERLTTPAAE